MKRVAEIIHIVESEREEFLKGSLNPDDETLNVMWACGVRKQQYFALGALIFMTFEYTGDNFKVDMANMSAYLEKKGHLVKLRRRDVPVFERETTNWWAPVKRLGTVLDSKPASATDVTKIADYSEMLSGLMRENPSAYDTSFDEDDWTEGMHF